MDPSTEWPEPVIAQGDHERPIVARLEGMADHHVRPTILVLDHPGHRCVDLMERVVGVPISPEHMLYAVGRVEEAIQEPLVEGVERAEEHGLALSPGEVALIEIGVLV